MTNVGTSVLWLMQCCSAGDSNGWSKHLGDSITTGDQYTFKLKLS